MRTAFEKRAKSYRDVLETVIVEVLEGYLNPRTRGEPFRLAKPPQLGDRTPAVVTAFEMPELDGSA
ncbi:MAG TPA: hypothetical protein VFH89_14090 [Sphingomicrobium sp.]|nr:hypothetical protein [Sphingomicrobium sp.]